MRCWLLLGWAAMAAANSTTTYAPTTPSPAPAFPCMDCMSLGHFDGIAIADSTMAWLILAGLFVLLLLVGVLCGACVCPATPARSRRYYDELSRTDGAD